VQPDLPPDERLVLPDQLKSRLLVPGADAPDELLEPG
jgi:hypothetical protein